MESRTHSREACQLANRFLRLLRREYSDGCRGRLPVEQALLSFQKHTQELEPSEATELRNKAKALKGYSGLGQLARQSLLIEVGHYLREIVQSRGPAEETSTLASLPTESSTLTATPRPSVPNSSFQLSTPIEKLHSISTSKRAIFHSLGLYTLNDLLNFYPRRWEDRRTFRSLDELRPGTFELIRAHVEAVKVSITSNRRRKLVEALVCDNTGSLKVTWFNQPYLAKQLTQGALITAFGKVDFDSFGLALHMTNPEFVLNLEDSPSFGRIVPIYRLTAKLYQSSLHKLMFKFIPTYAPLTQEVLPPEIVQKYSLMPRAQALVQMHWPSDYDSLYRAQQRLAFEELLLLQLRIAKQRKGRFAHKRQLFYDNLPNLVEEFQKLLPFSLTGAQKRSIKEIAADLGKDYPMNRMLQGDVGSGKTVVAAFAAFTAIKSGHQAAIMAPTEILAEQHYNKLCQLLQPTGIRLCLLKGSLTRKKKQEIADALGRGEYDLAVGTHALIQENVTFANLSLVVVDEQHKFGVLQRRTLSHKGNQLSGNDDSAESSTQLSIDEPKLPPQDPNEQEADVCDTLLMTATPIPRTMSLTIYGDLDLSKLDELPPGRSPIRSYCVPFDKAKKAYTFIAKQVEEGHQAYIVCPLINESDKLEASAAIQEAERLQNGVFKKYRVGLLHGKLKAAEKSAVMENFRTHQLDILISTTVIEVGVDVKNATSILIQDANRFGLAQLHQLRGRIGRGDLQSYCFFLASADCESNRKLEAAARLSDGFEIAEEDLEIRGPGDYFGTRQSGFPELMCADLMRDSHLLEIAKEEAWNYVTNNPAVEV